MAQKVEDITISNSIFYDLGTGAVLVSSQYWDLLVCSGINVTNNFIQKGGRVFPSTSAILYSRIHDSSITHNYISDFYYTAIAIGWSWDYGDQTTYGVKIAFNYIEDLMQGWLSDGDCVYTLGFVQNVIIEHN